ncbi:hypothetical protein DFH09DRAFT_1089042 [Mycena vulgaris]|nr:hypothetical protein DFH09DRAFT_1089042 [Mycena vulgaris]
MYNPECPFPAARVSTACVYLTLICRRKSERFVTSKSFSGNGRQDRRAKAASWLYTPQLQIYHVQSPLNYSAAMQQPWMCTQSSSGAIVKSTAGFIGPGKTLHEIYSSLGVMAERHANRAAHALGLGPVAVSERILIHFGDGRERESALNKLRTNIPRTLVKNCRKLVDYALPSESSSTQLDAFKSVVALTTRYPGVRHILLDSGNVNRGEDSEIAVLWDRPDQDCGQAWHFNRNFAAACLTDRDISSLVEAVESQNLGLVSDERAGLSIIERLVIFSDCEGESLFSQSIAVRYLGGILELPSFWVQTGALHRTVVHKLLARALLSLRDLGVESAGPADSAAGVLSDIEGTDILCEALLAGIQMWLPERVRSEMTHEPWYYSLHSVLKLLRHPKTEDLLPQSWAIATAPMSQKSLFGYRPI